MDTLLKSDERIDDLEFNGFKIIQSSSGFCFGIDAVLLSDFAKDIKQNSVVADLCSGTGIISILLAGKTSASKIYAVEIQEVVADMARRSINLNNLNNQIEIINDDLKNLSAHFELGSLDAIVTNPPYKKENSGITNISKEKLISRHEIMCNLEDVVSVSSRLLKNHGSFYMVHRPERLVDIMFLLRKYKLEPKLLRFVHPFEGKAPNLLLIKAVKGANSFLTVQNPLIVYNKPNCYTDEILKIYNKIKKEDVK